MPQGLLVNLGLMVGVAAFALLTSISHTAALATAGGLVLCAGAARRIEVLPKLGLWMIVGLVPLSLLGPDVSQAALLNSVTKLVFFLMLAALLIRWSGTGVRLAVGAQGIAAIVLCGIAMMSWVVHDSTAYAWPGLLRYFSHTLLLVLAANLVDNERDMAWIFGIVVATCAISAAAGVILHPTGGTVGSGPRLAGLSESLDAPTFASHLMMAVVISFYVVLFGKTTWVRVTLMAAGALLLYSLLLTAARSGIIAVAVGTAYLLFKARKRLPILPLLAVALLVTALVQASPGEWRDRMRRMFVAARQDAPIMWRYESSKVAFRLFLREPLIGLGPGNFTEDYMSPEFRFDRRERPLSTVGNAYVRVLNETGILGFICFAAIVVLSLRDLRFAQRSGAGPPDGLAQAAEIAEVYIVTFLVFAALNSMFVDKYLWVMFGAAYALAHIRRRRLNAAAASAQ